MNNIVAIILGNRLNDDGSISNYQKERLEMAIEIKNTFNPSKIILTGGVANPKALISEAQAMYDYLVNNGIDENLLIKEERSMSTFENALYSVPLAIELGADIIILCTSDYHFAEPGYGTFKHFINMINKDVKLMTYTKKTTM